MKIHLVRHARAISRADWRSTSGELDATPNATGPEPDLFDLLRPLNEEGQAQAVALADHLQDEQDEQDEPIGALPRLLSSPAIRCQQTLEPLALALGLPVEVDDRLADGDALTGVVDLIRELGGVPAVICCHSTTLRALLEFFELEPESDGDGPMCRKGALWTLEGPGPLAIERASYIEPARPSSGSKLRREVARPNTIRVGVLDMGSTSFTLLIADVTREGVIRPVVREKVMLRLGAVIAEHGKIPSSVVHEAVEVARELNRIAVTEKVEYFVPVATAALRDAQNGRKVADKITRAIGETVRILAGETEARLMFSAFQKRLALGEEPVLGIDLGGGSLELAVGCGERIDGECTLRLGAVRLQREFVSSDPMKSRDAKRIREHVRTALEPHRDTLLERSPERMVIAGGTPRAIARMIAAASGGSSGGDDALPVDIQLDELRQMAKRLVRSTHDERLAMPGTRRRRADLVATGALVLVTVAETLGIELLTFSDWGLREGVLLERVANVGPQRVAED